MEPRTVARILNLGRVAIGAALIVRPDLAASGWIGPDAERPATQVPLVSLGARDLVLGVGGMWSDHPRPWLVGAALSDLADLAMTVRQRDALPPLGVIGVSALAAGAAAAGLWAAAELD